MNRISIRRTVKEAAAFVVRNPHRIAAWSAVYIPAAVWGALPSDGVRSGPLILGYFAAAWVIVVAIRFSAVRGESRFWHRAMNRFGRVHLGGLLLFAGVLAGVLLLAFAITAAWPSTLSEDDEFVVAMLIAVLVVTPLVARFGFVFVLAAMDGMPSFKEAWRVTKGNTVRLTALSFIYYGFIIILVVLAIIPLAAAGLALPEGSPLFPFLLIPLDYLLFAIGCGATGGAAASMYRQLGRPMPRPKKLSVAAE